MKALARPLGFAVVAVVLAGACTQRPQELAGADAASRRTGSDASSSPSSTTLEAPDAGRPPLDQFCDDAYSADATRLRDKCSPADLNLSQAMTRSAAKLCARDLKVAVERSRATFDPDAAAKCSEMLRDKALARTSEVDTLFAHAPCDRVLVGTAGEGRPCLFSIECADGLACVDYKGGQDGKCKKPPKATEPCSAQPFGTILNEAAAALHHPACAKGAFCDGTKCRPRIAAGAHCDDSASCADGLACLKGTCGVRGPVDAPCMSSTDCVFGLWCDRAAPRTPRSDGGASADVPMGRCAAKNADGQPCASEDACKGRCQMKMGKDGRPHPPGTCASACGSG